MGRPTTAKIMPKPPGHGQAIGYSDIGDCRHSEYTIRAVADDLSSRRRLLKAAHG